MGYGEICGVMCSTFRLVRKQQSSFYHGSHVRLETQGMSDSNCLAIWTLAGTSAHRGRSLCEACFCRVWIGSVTGLHADHRWLGHFVNEPLLDLLGDTLW